MYETRWGLQLPFDPSEAPLRSTPKAWRSRDPAVFPCLAAMMRKTGCPHYFYLHAPANGVRVYITIDAFFAPPTLAARLSAQYTQYVRWWRARLNPERRRSPSTICLPSFRDYVSLIVLRTDAPVWIALLEACAPFCYSQWDELSRAGAMERWGTISAEEVAYE